MAGLNVVVLTGNLTRDPELKNLPSGSQVCNMRIAVNERFKDSSGEWQERPNYFDLTAWGGTANICGQYLARGTRVTIQGRLHWREWEAQDGSKRQAVDINVDHVVFPSKAESGGGDRPRQDSGGSGSYGVPTSQPAAPTSAPIADDDDIPFRYCDLFDLLLV